MRAVFALLIAHSLAGEPVADSVEVVEVQTEGRISDVVRSKVGDAVRDGLGRGQLEVGQDPGSAKYRLQTTVTRDGRDYEFKLVLTDAASGEVLADVSDSCDICGVDEVADLIAGAAALLGQQIDQLKLGAPKLLVTSTPGEATVYIDGEEVGVTPFEGEVSPGPHVVRISKDGHVTVEREMELAKGVHSTADFLLERETTRTVLPPDRAFGLGWAGLAAGAVVLGAGIGLVAVDGREYEPRCGPGNQDGDGDCKFVLETRWGGAAAIAVGAMMASAGVALVLTSRRGRSRGKARASISPAVTPGGVLVTGRF